MTDEHFMKQALKQAQKAYKADEVPIGAVIVYDNKIIARGYNQRNTKKNALKHAEIIAIEKASKFFKDWRLEECTIYVTVEPCLMCAGAILQARIKNLVYGAPNEKFGSVGSIVDILSNNYNHKVNIKTNVLENECKLIMQKFFKIKIRNK